MPGGSWARASQPARMRCGKVACKQACKIRTSRNPRECAVAKIMSARCAALVTVSQPARMRCGKVAPLLCPNRKLREHELRSSFLVSPPVILVVTFYMTAQLLKLFNRVQQKPPHQNCPMRRCILLISEPVSTEPAGIVRVIPTQVLGFDTLQLLLYLPPGYSHSIVPGGLSVISNITRLTWGVSAIILLLIVRSRS